MELTEKQEKGLETILTRYNLGLKYTTISGYAGTGKSTLVKFAIAALGVREDRVAYATFTGKAAEVLRKKGNTGACTLHKLLYDHFPKPGGGFIRKPKTSLDYDVVVVDEVSMAPKSMIDMLLSHRVYVIFLGDPFQLPQINKDESHDILENAHIFLDEVMRQAAESEIIQISMKIRNGEPIDFMKGKEVIIIPKSELVEGHLTWADQILCGTNATRENINRQMREIYGFSGLLQDGEKMICLRNYWDDCADNGDALVNGTTGILRNPFETFRMIPNYIPIDNHRMDVIQGDFVTSDGSTFNSVEMDKKFLIDGVKCITDGKILFRLGKLKNKIGDIVPREFTFGYAITGWKAQGSEWDHVLAIEERFPFDKKEHARFLYTVCTRASKKLVLVRDK